MSTVFPFPRNYFYPPERREFSRGDIEDFVREYSFSDDKREVYEKSKRIADIVDTVGEISLLVLLVSFVTIIIYPIYSLGAGLLFDIMDVPQFLDQFIAERPTIQISTLVFIFAMLLLSLFMSLLSFRVSSTFENYADKTGIDSDSLEFRKVAESYLAYKDEDSNTAISRLEEYDHYPGSRYISEYTDAAKSQGRVDTEYIDRTFEEFLGLFIEYTHSSSKDERTMMMRAIADRESEYLISESLELEEGIEEEEEFKDTYVGIVGTVFGRLISSVPQQVYSLTIQRPIVVYVALLLIGGVLINVNATLALVVVTVFVAGFDTWKRNRETDDREAKPSDKN